MAIIVIVQQKLQDVEWSASISDPVVETQCLLGSDYNNNSLCVYAYAVCGLSLIFSFVIALLLVGVVTDAIGSGTAGRLAADRGWGGEDRKSVV